MTRVFRESVVVAAVVAVLCVAGLAVGAPVGTIPPPLTPAFHVGISDATDHPGVWIRDARARGANFTMRYRYLVTDASGGWTTNWTPGGPANGNFAKSFLDGTPIGVTPAFSWYEMLGVSGSEGNEYATLTNVAAMRRYFTDFRLLMNVCKTYGRPVFVHLEPDAYAYFQQESGGNTNAPAAVASTGLPELAGLPNTVQGWGQAFGRIRAAVGATNVSMGPHFSTWASGTDLMRGAGVSADIATHVGRTATFLQALGTYEMIWTEWLDRDAQTRGIWWDVRDDAGTNTQSFRRDLEIFRTLNRLTNRRLVLWQVPHGTTWSAIKSHHAEYVFGPGGAGHRAAMTEAGIVATLFGSGATGQTTHLNGWGPDGGLYLRTEVARQLGGFDGGLDGGSVVPDSGVPDAGQSVIDAGFPDAGRPCRCWGEANDFACRCP